MAVPEWTDEEVDYQLRRIETAESLYDAILLVSEGEHSYEAVVTGKDGLLTRLENFIKAWGPPQ